MATETKKKATKTESAEVKEPKAKKVAKTASKTAKTTKAKETKAVEPKAKVEKVKAEVVETKKPLVTEAHASALTLKVTPRKCRMVCDLVRNKNCNEALEILFNTHKEASTMVAKVIKSAMANAVNNFNMNEDKLYVASIMASDSVKMRRFLPRAKGSASGMVKRFSNLYVTVKERN